MLVALVVLQLSCKKTDELSSTYSKRDNDLQVIKQNFIYDQYFWGINKIPLAIDSTAAIFLSQDPALTMIKVKKAYGRLNFQKLNSGYFLVRANEKIEIGIIKECAINAQYVYVDKSSQPMIITGEVSL